MKLIPEWRKAWRMTSVQLAIVGVVLNAAATGWSSFQGQVDPMVYAVVNMALGIAVAVSRVIKQPKLADDPERTE